MEVKTPEEVTVEGLLERVLPFFVVDHQDYSVQWPLGGNRVFFGAVSVGVGVGLKVLLVF